MIANQRTSPLRFTMAIQKDPSLKNTTSDLNRRGIYYDVGYEYNEFKTSILFKTRFFSGGSPSNQYVAPYSSGHSLDGYSNSFQSSVINGFNEDFRSFQLGFTTKLPNKQTISINGYFFRNGLITKNLGSEFNLAVSKPIVSNTIKWTYKLSQYIRGNHSTNNSELNMWLDFSISLNDK